MPVCVQSQPLAYPAHRCCGRQSVSNFCFAQLTDSLVTINFCALQRWWQWQVTMSPTVSPRSLGQQFNNFGSLLKNSIFTLRLTNWSIIGVSTKRSRLCPECKVHIVNNFLYITLSDGKDIGRKWYISYHADQKLSRAQLLPRLCRKHDVRTCTWTGWSQVLV